MLLTRDQSEKFERDGFVRGARAVSDEQVEALRAETARVIADRGQDKPQPVLLRNLGSDEAPVWQIVNICDASDEFMKLVHDPAIVETVASLMGAQQTVRLWHDQIQYKPASTGGPNHWHQDAPLWPTLAPMTQVTAWIALDDVDAENGAMVMVPGSHRWGDHMQMLGALGRIEDMPTLFEGREIRIDCCPVPKGHVHFHHALTWHGSTANISGRPRRAIALHYMSEATKFVAAGEHVMKPFIESAAGETVRGARFPVVWSR